MSARSLSLRRPVLLTNKPHHCELSSVSMRVPSGAMPVLRRQKQPAKKSVATGLS